MSLAEPLVRARNVRKSYGDNEVLKGIDLDVLPGEVVVILGPSGSGKSTFLRCINHLEELNAGSIMVGEQQVGFELKNGGLHRLSPKRIARQRQEIGMVFQQFNLYPHMTVLQNIIEAPVGVHKRPRAEAIAEANVLLATVGLSDKADAWPRHLSGGQQQRVAIARALALKPKRRLVDVRTWALDP
ncbi:amino acid ABC transporter ATP-binding protein, partial [Pseudomonas cerasi]